MTATAFAFDPILDPSDAAVAPVVAPRRRELRLIEGEGYGQIIPATPSSTPMPDPVSVEVYRRRRFLALVAITALVLGIAWAAGVSVVSFGASAAPASDTTPAVHVVLPGDSYAAIAAGLGAPYPLVAAVQLRVANGGGELVVGERLVIDPATLISAG